jgi:hypothetical protein
VVGSLPVTPERNLTGRCGTCIFFIPRQTDASGASQGECRLGCWPAPLRDTATCASHQAPGQKPRPPSGRGAQTRREAQPRAGSVREVHGAGAPPRFGSIREVPGADAPPRVDIRGVPSAGAPPRFVPQEVSLDMDQEEFRKVLREVLLDELGVRDIELGDRWQGGELVLVPGKEGVQEKRVPIDNLFRKVVMIREKLRVLEQKINAHEKLDDNDRLQLQQYVTQCYGSLTTFNVLFKNKDDQFVGQAGKE